MLHGTQLLPGCPGYELNQLAPPNIDWCEESVCSFIAEPANTWSNLGYLFAGVFLIWAARGRSPTLRSFGPALIVVGATSFLYHATNNFYSQVFDFLGMYVFTYLLILLNARRLGAVSSKRMVPLFAGAVIATTVVTALLSLAEIRIQLIVLLQIFVIIGTEALARRRRTAEYGLRFFFAAVVFIAIGAAFSASDVSRAWCDPTNHVLQGHAIWHVFGALSLTAAYFHYAQFAEFR